MKKLKLPRNAKKHLRMLKKGITGCRRKKQPEAISAIDIIGISPGMYWFEDDTFSKARLLGKRIKAVVELVCDGVIYGDLTASEIANIKEQPLKYGDAKKYVGEFSCLCKKNEEIVLYHYKLLDNVSRTYGLVRKKLMELGKSPRSGWQWSSTECGENVRVRYFGEESSELFYECGDTYVRPVIALKVF